ncbi:MAG: redox-sensing transcriptional repressor Rex, partial [Dehalococcoidia bacterium]|nr:redox-sensing transcriptional repressor Rex [Dehalococcoidia bacterium]
MNDEIPEVVILRLPLYARVLDYILSQGVQVASSQALGNLLQATPAQIRKDLSYFGRFGKQGRGYNVSYLLGEIRQILGLDHAWHMAVVGTGQLGTAIVNYAGFADQGFMIVAAFDSDS